MASTLYRAERLLALLLRIQHGGEFTLIELAVVVRVPLGEVTASELRFIDDAILVLVVLLQVGSDLVFPLGWWRRFGGAALLGVSAGESSCEQDEEEEMSGDVRRRSSSQMHRKGTISVASTIEVGVFASGRE